jgi:hypothetical protein
MMINRISESDYLLTNLCKAFRKGLHVQKSVLKHFFMQLSE